MSLAFRNVNVSPEDSVEIWSTEAVLTALERGGLGHWRRLTAAPLGTGRSAPRWPPRSPGCRRLPG